MGNCRSSPLTTKSPIQGENKRLVFCANSMPGWRRQMNDAYVAIPQLGQDCSLFCVFDGFGCPVVAKLAEKHLPEELLKNKNFKKRNYDAALIQSFLKIDELLISQCERKKITVGRSHHRLLFADCSANVVLITKTEIYCANVGNSRSVLSVEGKADALSIDHNPEDEKELTRIKQGGGYVKQGRVNGKINVSRALGHLQLKNDKSLRPEDQVITAFPDVQKRTLTGAEYIVMGSDGLWESKTNQQMVDYVGLRINTYDLKQITEQLLEDLVAPQSNDEHGCDNMTTIVVKFKN